jgi:hypothetical protein
VVTLLLCLWVVASVLNYRLLKYVFLSFMYHSKWTKTDRAFSILIAILSGVILLPFSFFFLFTSKEEASW